ncbi:hypothetical protein FRC12_021706 [Ceratobasidium sp. 428]|nr:hypothetical protein FRC09_003459 [Ceratobasidium sp. 395]KAG8794783.1 hypothetical protein FRC12_021706 [Ceratobasidium sp. 428]
MAPIEPYICICLEKQYDNRKSLSLHENKCPVIKARDQIRYSPYHRQHRVEQPIQTYDEPAADPTANEDTNEDSSAAPACLVLIVDTTDDVPDAQGTAPPDDTETRHGLASPTAATNTYPTTRSHARRLLQGYRNTYDALPEAPPPLEEAAPPPVPQNRPTHTRLRFVPFETPPDTFGRFQIYPSRPLTIPDHNTVLEDFTDQDVVPDIPNDSAPTKSISNTIHPCPNLSTFYLLRWFWKGSNKSIESCEELVTNVLLRPGFNPSDLRNVSLPAIDKKLAAAASYSPQGDESFAKSDGWAKISVPLQIPTRRRGPNGHLKSGRWIMAPGLNARKILTGIRRGFERFNPKYFHHEPYTSKWIPPGASKSEAQTLMDEIYCSPAMLEYHKDIQKTQDF